MKSLFVIIVLTILLVLKVRKLVDRKKLDQFHGLNLKEVKLIQTYRPRHIHRFLGSKMIIINTSSS